MFSLEEHTAWTSVPDGLLTTRDYPSFQKLLKYQKNTKLKAWSTQNSGQCKGTLTNQKFWDISKE